MRKLLVCLCILVLTVSLFAEEKVYDNSLEKGKFALQFGISGGILENMQLTSFNGSTFSGKYQFSPKNAVRLGLFAGISGEEINSESISRQRDSNETRKENHDYASSIFNVQISYIRYLSKVDNFHLYTGIGPRFELNNYSVTRDFTNPDYTQIISQDRETYTYGLTFLCGTEWFIRKNISFIFEYNSNFTFEKNLNETKTESEYTENPEEYSKKDNSNEFRFKSNQIKLGISIYF